MAPKWSHRIGTSSFRPGPRRTAVPPLSKLPGLHPAVPCRLVRTVAPEGPRTTRAGRVPQAVHDPPLAPAPLDGRRRAASVASAPVAARTEEVRDKGVDPSRSLLTVLQYARDPRAAVDRTRHGGHCDSAHAVAPGTVQGNGEGRPARPATAGRA